MFAFTFWQLPQHFCEIQCPSKLILWCLASYFCKEWCLLKANTEVNNNSPDSADYAKLASTFWRAVGVSIIHCPSIPERWSYGQPPQIHYNLREFAYYPIWPQLSISKNWQAQLAFENWSEAWFLIKTHIWVGVGDGDSSMLKEVRVLRVHPVHPHMHKRACTSQRVKHCLKTRTIIKLYLLSRQE